MSSNKRAIRRSRSESPAAHHFSYRAPTVSWTGFFAAKQNSEPRERRRPDEISATRLMCSREVRRLLCCGGFVLNGKYVLGESIGDLSGRLRNRTRHQYNADLETGRAASRRKRCWQLPRQRSVSPENFSWTAASLLRRGSTQSTAAGRSADGGPGRRRL
jgi:hypothetical protein